MRIRLDVEIPSWTRWIVVGLIVGVGFGYGIATVRADSVQLSTWNSGDVLTAASLNKNFQDLQNAINAQQAALNALIARDCPPGYARQTTTEPIVLCKRGADEMVKVGTGTSAFWIDRYEASIWSGSDGTGTQYGVMVLDALTGFPATFPPNGQYSAPLYALSLPNVIPSAYVTWFQAAAACEASGKRLPTSYEWLRAARGTVDPGANDGSQGFCVTMATTPRATGKGSKCSSAWGAEDMIGNVTELAQNWYASPESSSTEIEAAFWRNASMNGDWTCGIDSYAYEDGYWLKGTPAAVAHGGMYDNAAAAGIFSTSIFNSPNYTGAATGFRCVTTQ